MSTQPHDDQQLDGERSRYSAPLSAAQPPPGRRRMQRKVHVSTAATVVLGMPWFLVSGGLIGSLLLIPGFEIWGWVILIGWLLSGTAMFWRPGEDMLMRVLGRLHRPTHAEQQQLDAVWGSVAQAAGIETTKYSLLIQESEEINAIAAGGHTVAVTRKALETLPPDQLKAILAHELGHHLGGHTWVTLLMYWYAVPARLAWPLAMTIRWCILAAYRITLNIVNFILKLIMFLIPFGGVAVFVSVYFMRAYIFVIKIAFAVAMISLAVQLLPLFLLISIMVIALAWFNRLREKYADQVAARLGYGPALIQVLQDRRTQGEDSERAKLGLLARLLSNDPSLSDRIRAMEHYLQQNQEGIR